MAKKWMIFLEVETDTDPNGWAWDSPLVIDEPYTVMSIEEDY